LIVSVQFTSAETGFAAGFVDGFAAETADEARATGAGFGVAAFVGVGFAGAGFALAAFTGGAFFAAALTAGAAFFVTFAAVFDAFLPVDFVFVLAITASTDCNA
jgi:hypothetical protein